MKMKLTERAIARLKPPASGKLDVWDQTLPAFGIQLRATGRRAWIIAVRRPGKSTTSRIRIGDPATMALAEAQARARALMRDPSAPQRGRTNELDAIDPDGLDRRQPHGGGDRRLHRARPNAAEPELEERSSRSSGMISPAGTPVRSAPSPWDDWWRALDGVLARGRPIMANLLLAHIKRLFNWTIERGLIETSPVAQGATPPSSKRERERVLTDQEIHEVWHGCDRLGWPFGPLVQLLMLTAQREGEVASMRWSDVDFDTGIWTLDRRLGPRPGRAHLVPLSSAALAASSRRSLNSPEGEYISRGGGPTGRVR